MKKMGKVKLLLQAASAETVSNILDFLVTEPNVQVTELHTHRITTDKYFISLRFRCPDKDMKTVQDHFIECCSEPKKSGKGKKK